MGALPADSIEIASAACRCCGGDDRDVLTADARDVEDGVPGRYEIARCCACGLVYLSRSPTPKSLEACYPQTYYTRDDRSLSVTSRTLYRVKHWLRFRSLPNNCTAVLEVGCGNGAFLSYVRERWPSARLVGTEIGFGDIVPSNGIEFIEIEAEQLSLPAQFDLALMHQVLEHLADPIEGLRRIKAALNPEGVLIGEVPNWGSPWRRIFGEFWGGLQIPRHQSFFDAASLTAVLRKAGFTHVELTYPPDPGDLSVSLCNWLTAKLALRASPRRAWFFMPLMAACAPVVWAQTWLLSQSGNLAFKAS
jgi:SAM-dependent methyltransferase